VRSYLRALACGLALCVTMGAPAWAQSPPASAAVQSAGTISGKVVDGTGKPIGGVHVFIAGPVSTGATTRADGTYNVSVPQGIYSVTFSASGFQSTQQDNVAVVAGTAVSLATTLTNATLATIANVSVGGSTSVSDSSSASSKVTAATIQNQGQDQVTNVLDQVPGVEIYRWSGGSNEPGANASVSVRGAQPYESQILIDGHPVDTLGNGPDGFNAAFLNAILLGGIEVGKGPGSMPNTVADAVGGTVNFQTAPVTASPTGEFMTQYDNFGGWTYGLRFSDTIGKLGFLVGIARETTPGYMSPQYIFGFGRASFFSPYTSPTYPLTGNNQVYPTGTSYVGVLNYDYLATSDYQNDAQLFKLSYDFSPVTSLTVSSMSTQTWLDETGNNIGNVYAKIVPCISTYPAAATCAPGTAVNYNENYTNQAFAGLIGQTVPINLYAGYNNTYETDNEPLYTADLRTVVGPGTLLARFYAGSITRNVIQDDAFGSIGPCFSPSCAWVGNIPGSATNDDAFDNGYSGEPYDEETTDTLHGFDAQYTVPFGDADTLTFGYDNHSDSYAFTEAYSGGWYPPCVTVSCAYGLDFYPEAPIKLQSSTESIRGSFQVAKKLQLEVGGYGSNTTFIGSRFDPRAGLTWRPNSDVSLRASAGSAFVTPYDGLLNLEPTYVDKHVLYPTIGSFNPETSMGYDLGGDFKYARDSIFSVDLYSTTIYNRYAQTQLLASGTYDGDSYTSEVVGNSQGQSANKGLELTLNHQPRFGFGYRVEADLLRDYSYDQFVPISAKATAKASDYSVFYALPADDVQLPGYPFSKIRADLTYAFRNGMNLRFSSMSYGANNAYGQPGFTTFDGALTLPVKQINVLIGASNIFNKDDGQTGGLYYGGYTYQALGGGIGPTNWEYAQPRTVFVQLSQKVGR
jgi:outer membrane receptor protein involved in Fe transport